MKRFTKKTIFFLIPLTVVFIEVFLPINVFTYRPWEALLYQSKRGIAFPFYPNQKLDMYSVGDLCHHTTDAIIKHENWTTDKLGFRNDTFNKKVDILFIGDSFIAGSSLPQDSTITNLVQSKTKLNVYNMAPSNFNEFVSLISQGIIERPNIVVFEIVERNIPPRLLQSSNEFYKSNADKTSVIKDRIERFYLKNFLKSRISESRGNGKQGKARTSKTKMFFLNGLNQHYHYDKINEVSENIIQYKKYCDSIDVDFIFLPLPNKETVYYDNVPFDYQPDYLFKLDSVLNQNEIFTINTLKIFNDVKGNKLLYHIDDTHWNSNGVNIIATKLIEKARTHNILYK